MPRSPRSSVKGIALALGLLGLLPLAAAAGNLGFLKKTAVAYFQQDDVDLMLRNARGVLDATAPDAQSSWKNERTGASGRAQISGDFTGADGVPCRRLHVVNRARGVEDEATYTVCRYHDRGWVLHTQGEPAS